MSAQPPKAASPTPAQLACLRNVQRYRCSGATRLDVFMRCIRNGWIQVKTKGCYVRSEFSVLTPAGRDAVRSAS